MSDKLMGGQDSMMGWIRCKLCGKVNNRPKEPRCHCNDKPATQSPTPRTDAFVKDKACPDVYSQDWADEITDFARTLERELSSAKKEIERLKKLLQEAYQSKPGVERHYEDLF